MIDLTPEEIANFRDLWREAFNEELTAGEAKIKAEQLMGLYGQLARRLRKGKQSTSKDRE
jgi:hypothetical protein